jgi:predicted phosphodiesterase
MTKILVISDIHANLPAFEAVLADAADDFDAAWCLGDVVGYGARPNECVELLKSLPNLVCLLGNHDAAVLGQIDVETFNLGAAKSALWTQKSLSHESFNFLRTLPERTEALGVTLVHGSPRNPVWEYLMDIYSARDNFSAFDTAVCLVGHTHVPLIYELDREHNRAVLTRFINPVLHRITTRAILNPGSVGQPRDYDSRAAYAIFSLEEQLWDCRRVPYDIPTAQKWILEAGLPHRHAERLEFGW